QDLEIQAIDQVAQSFRGASDAVDHLLGSESAGVEGVDPITGVVGVTEISQALQEVEVEGLDEGSIAAQGVGFEGADVLRAGIGTPAVRAGEAPLIASG